VQEHVADRLPRHEQAARPDQHEPPHPLRMAHRQFGGDPAADAMADQIETLEPSASSSSR
jgi:hypothetical protein